MINPIDHQLALWKVEQNAQDNKDPASPMRQALQGNASVEEADRRDNSVQSGDESRESQKSGVGDRRGKGNKRQTKSKKDRSSKAAEDKSDGGLDLYA